MPDPTQYLTLGLDRDLFGIDIRHVREILDMQPIATLPHAPHFLLGMTDVRGAGYPVLDLRLKLGLPWVAPTSATRIVLVDAGINDRTIRIGFVADRVIEVTALDRERLDPAPDVGGRWQSAYIAGIGHKAEAFVVVLDLDRLMAHDGDIVAASQHLCRDAA